MKKDGRKRGISYFIRRFLLRFFRLSWETLTTLVMLMIILIAFKLEISQISNMVFYLAPVNQFVDSYNNEIKTVSFMLETQSNYPCVINCNYEFIDISNNITIEKGILEFSRLNDSAKTYRIQSPLFGAGQKIYNFNVACRNNKTSLCWLKNNDRHATAIVVLNYRLKEEEEQLKNRLRNELQDILANLSYADILIQVNEIMISDVDSIVNFNEIMGQKAESDADFSSAKKGAEYLRNLWDMEDYSTLNDNLNSSFKEEISGTINELNATGASIENVIAMHNSLANIIESKRMDTKAMLNFLAVTGIQKNVLNETKNFLALFNGIFDDFKARNFAGYSDIENRIRTLNLQGRKVKTPSSANFVGIMKAGYSVLEQNYDLLCKMKGYCIDYEKEEIFDDAKSNLIKEEEICKKISGIRKLAREADNNFTLYYYNLIHPNSTIDAEEAYNNLSRELNLRSYNENEEFNDTRNKTLGNMITAIKNDYIRKNNAIADSYNNNISILNSNISYLGLRLNQSSLDYCIYIIRLINAENNSIKKEFLLDEFQQVCNENPDNNASIINSTAENIPRIANISKEDEILLSPIDIKNETIRNLFADIFKIAMNLSHMKDAEDYQKNYCTVINSSAANNTVNPSVFQNSSFLESSLNYSTIKKYDVTTRINAKLKEHFPLCCIFGKCEICCRNESCRDEESLFPVIMIHGHGFDKGDSPTFSTDIFDKLQRALQNDGYIISGIVTPAMNYSNAKENELGAIRKPISMKATYYIDFNDENFNETELNLGIENYTKRIYDMIEFVKFRTGKSKVNIIAHSMGGLIARRYLELFGEDSVDKLIMVSTPNNGISENTKSLCLIAGRERECYDMMNNSLFIKKVNDLALKNKTKLYNIYGSGCETDGGDGDKVVSTTSAILQNAKNYEVKGNCTSILDVFHMKILDTYIYPKTYEIIKGILKE